MTKCLATLRRFRTLRRLQWKLPGGAVNGWHRHRHRPGPELPVDTANEGWGLLTGHQRGPAPGHTRGLSHGHGHSCAWCGPPVPGKMACRPGDGAAAGSSPNHRGWQPVPDQDHSYSPGAQGGLSATSASVRQRYAPAVGSCSLLSARGIWRPPPHLLWQVLATSWRAAWPDTGLTWRARDSHHQGVASGPRHPRPSRQDPGAGAAAALQLRRDLFNDVRPDPARHGVCLDRRSCGGMRGIEGPGSAPPGRVSRSTASVTSDPMAS